jgi:CRP/FNR family transcriptional regulator, cyclic AMP receptor protein
MNLEALLRDETDIVHHAAGAVVFDQDDPGDSMYVVRQGTVDLLVGGVVVETVTAGGLFGEMALLDRTERSATAIARDPTTVVRVSRARFQELVRAEPRFALHVMGVLADRLRRTTAAH